MNAVFYWCGCRTDFEGDEPPPFCAQHKDSIERIQLDEVEEVVEETSEEETPVEETPEEEVVEEETPPEVPPVEPKMKPKTKPSKR